MSFEQTPDFYDRLTRDQDFRTQVLAAIAADDELQSLDENELTAILGGQQFPLPRPHNLYMAHLPVHVPFPVVQQR